jgi:hypothetical protein
LWILVHAGVKGVFVLQLMQTSADKSLHINLAVAKIFVGPILRAAVSIQRGLGHG